jgi:hypothetical protein
VFRRIVIVFSSSSVHTTTIKLARHWHMFGTGTIEGFSEVIDCLLLNDYNVDEDWLSRSSSLSSSFVMDDVLLAGEPNYILRRKVHQLATILEGVCGVVARRVITTSWTNVAKQLAGRQDEGHSSSEECSKFRRNLQKSTKICVARQDNMVFRQRCVGLHVFLM